MTSTVNKQEASRLTASFLQEYNSEDSIRKYTRKTAGYGISYLLGHEYGRIYLDCIEKHVSKSRQQAGLRIWEFGCGGGMNLLHLVSTLAGRNAKVDVACGTDFSEALIAAARGEARNHLSPKQVDTVRFAVARNENLVEDGANGLGIGERDLLESFDFVFGVNTIRYGHRLNNVDRCVESVRKLLRKGGICVVIDMNQKFPAFRSRFRETLNKRDEIATYLPTLEEYAQPFSKGGFEVLAKKNFCWVPHSAGRGLTTVLRAATPVLNTVAPSRAMRSLVIARKIA